MKKIAPFIPVFVLGFVLSSNADGQVVSITASADNSIFEESTNSSGGGSLFVGNTNGGNARRSLLLFDIASSIPAGSTIDSVEFLFSVDREVGGNRGASLHRATTGWGEGTVVVSGAGGQGGPAGTGDATWQHSAFDSVNWSVAGGDFEATASQTFSIDGTGGYSISAPGLVADVQTFLDTPANNFGWFLLGDETETRTAKRLVPRESGGEGPRLSVSFTAVPEPGAGAALLLLGVVGGMKRRR